ncbi:MAG: UbiD family decarboxylase, partial [Acidimicrobiia bacterium]
VDQIGELRVVEGADWEENIGRASEMLHHTDDAPAVLFDRIPGYPSGYRVLVNSLATRGRIALTLGLDPGIDTFGLVDAWEELMSTVEPQPVRIVEDGPILENVMEGDDIDLHAFPTPLWHEEDGGRYIGTGDAVVTKDRNSDWVNMGTYRVMIQDEKRAGLYISPNKDGQVHQRSYFEAGEPMPVVVLAGVAPIHFMASALEIPRGVSEMEWIGGVVGEPIECFPGRHTGLPIPVGAEIAIEGFVHPNSTMMEGPFGEWTGYYASASRQEPVIDVAAIYHRDDPILLGCPPEKPPYEAQRFQQYLRSGNLQRQIRAAGVSNVVAAWTHAVGGCRLFNVVSIKNSHPGHARQTLYVASQVGQASYLGRIVVVVDDDIDVTDLNEVVWAICTRTDPARDTDVIERVLSGSLDPALRPGEKT